MANVTTKPKTTGTVAVKPSPNKPPAAAPPPVKPTTPKPVDTFKSGEAGQGTKSGREDELATNLLAAYDLDSNPENGNAGGTLEVKTPESQGSAPKPTGREPVKDFKYSGSAPGDYRGAVDSSDPKAGTKANAQVNKEYDQLSDAYRDYLGADVASFPSMAKHGSVLAGTQIRNLENTLAGLKGDPKAMADAVRGMGGNKDTIIQGAFMGKGLVENAASDENPVATAVAPGVVAGKVAGETVVDGLRTANKMRDGLVAGNTEIHHSAAPAAHAFLKGEADGGRGMEELKKAGYTPGSEHDPHGMYTKAYGMLKDVRRLGLEAADEKDPAKKAQLEKQRDELMKSSNMHLFTQEQLTLEQPHIYGDKDMKSAVQSIGGTMKLEDPNGTYNLLPKGGDWTDYKTRMGYKEVDSPSDKSVSITGPGGKKIHYEADPNATGTVSHYSNTHSVGPKAKKLAVAPVGTTDLPAPTTSTGKGVDGIGNGLATGNVGEVVGSGATLPARFVSDAGIKGGNALQKNGSSNQQQGVQTFLRNARDVPGFSDDINRVKGAGQIVLGEMERQVGQTMTNVNRTAGAAIEVLDKGIETGVNQGVKTARDLNRKAYKARMKVQNELAKLWPF